MLSLIMLLGAVSASAATKHKSHKKNPAKTETHAHSKTPAAKK